MNVGISSFAADIDQVILLVAVLVGFWFFLSEAVFFYFIFRYRKQNSPKAAYITGVEKDLALGKWITRSHTAILIFDVVILFFAVRIWVNVKQTLPAEPVPHVRVVSQQWAWSFVHPGPDGLLDTADDIKSVDDLHIRVNQAYIWELESRDVLHSFSIPAMRLKQDAVPGRVIKGWFDANTTGVFEIQCAEICGIGHGLMPAKLHVEDAAAHMAWMQAHAPVSRIAAN